MSKDTFTLGGKEFSSRFILGSGKYSMELIKAAVENAQAEIITLAVRRTNTRQSENILDYIPDNVTLLPNTSGARDAKEAVRIARMARTMQRPLRQQSSLLRRDSWCFRICIRICMRQEIWSMPELLL